MAQTNNRLRVLVLAHPDIAKSICSALRDLLDADCTAAEPAANKDCRLTALCRDLFQAGDAPAAARPSTHLYEWSWYDLVVVQDAWILEHEGAHMTLEFGGPVLASFDHYTRGNFATRKAILVTDPELFAHRLGLSSNHDHASILRLMTSHFDEKSAMEFVPMSGDTGSCLRRILSFARGVSGNPVAQLESAAGRPRNATIAGPVMIAATERTRDFIERHCEVLMVEDEYGELSKVYGDLTRKQLACASGAGGVVHICAVKTGDCTDGASTFDELERECVEAVDRALGKDSHVIVVTDILFTPPAFVKTGVDLIEALRNRFRRKIGIVAFTSFSTPCVAMSAYQRGADYVVQKGDVDSASRHETLIMRGSDRLMFALAMLCFQREFLRGKRRFCARLIDENHGGSGQRTSATASHIEHLFAALPRHMVSIHLQQEWTDTYELLRSMQFGWIATNELKRMVTEAEKKYNDTPVAR